MLISPSGQTTGLIDNYLRQQGLSRQVELFLPHILAAPDIIAGGNLIMCLSHRLAVQFETSHAVTIFAPPLPHFEFTVSMAWPFRKTEDPALIWLKTALGQAAA